MLQHVTWEAAPPTPASGAFQRNNSACRVNAPQVVAAGSCRITLCAFAHAMRSIHELPLGRRPETPTKSPPTRHRNFWSSVCCIWRTVVANVLTTQPNKSCYLVRLDHGAAEAWVRVHNPSVAERVSVRHRQHGVQRRFSPFPTSADLSRTTRTGYLVWSL